MTDEKLNELETVCRVAKVEGGKVSLHSGDVLALIAELRELRAHAADLSSHEGAIGNLHRLLASLGAYGERRPSAGLTVSSHIAIQDPGR